MGLDTLLFLSALASAGLAAGLIGGLFGVGGGIVLVPALVLLLGALGYGEDVRAHVAVGTSLSTIIVTSWRSMSAHAKAGAVDFAVLRGWGPFIALGAAAGAALAGATDGHVLILIFAVCALLVAAQMAFGTPRGTGGALPTGPAKWAIGGGLGLLSAMMGIGGGVFGTTLMTLCGRPIHQAVATASGFGFAIAIPATIGFVLTGWGAPGLPPGSLGYVSGPGFLLLALLTGLTAPVGARLAHRLDQRRLRQAFAVFLVLMAANLFREALG